MGRTIKILGTSVLQYLLQLFIAVVLNLFLFMSHLTTRI